MKKRTDGRYCKQIQVGYHPDGRRKMKTIYGKTIKEVEKREREIKGQMDCGIKIFDDMTVGEWAKIWLDTFKTNIAHNTHVRYENIVEKYVVKTMGHLPLAQVSVGTIQILINQLKGELAPATIKKIKDVLHQIFKQAVRAQYIVTNPVDGVDIPKLTQQDRTPIPDSHIQTLTNFCEYFQHGNLIMTLLYTGMRRGEILALTVEDIDFQNKTIVVNKAVEFLDNTPHIKPPKTRKGTRIIPILDVLIPYLQSAIQNKSEKDVVFDNGHGEMFTKSSINRLIKRFNEQYNRYLSAVHKVNFTMHQFRHTFCTMLYNAGVDVKAAQEILGHSTINITLDIYTHLNEKQKNINTNKLNEYISNNRQLTTAC